MMEAILVIIGLFILAAIFKNKELSESKENRDVFTVLFIIALICMLSGLPFIFPASTRLFPNYSFLIPVFVFTAIVKSVSSGSSRVIAQVALVSMLFFMILGAH